MADTVGIRRIRRLLVIEVARIVTKDVGHLPFERHEVPSILGLDVLQGIRNYLVHPITMEDIQAVAEVLVVVVLRIRN